MTEQSVIPATFGIRKGYIARSKPDYFVDQQIDGKLWQPDVLPMAAHLARSMKCKTIIDIGCGRGEKLKPYATEFEIIGVDFGDNLNYCRETHDFGRWLECDLEQSTPDIDSETLKQAVVVCSDVIEHLVNPERLALTLAMMSCCAPVVMISTPDRKRTYGYDHNGPPTNPHHVREWTRGELQEWLGKYGLHASLKCWTRSNNVDAESNTTLLMFAPSGIDLGFILLPFGLLYV